MLIFSCPSFFPTQVLLRKTLSTSNSSPEISGLETPEDQSSSSSTTDSTAAQSGRSQLTSAKSVEKRLQDYEKARSRIFQVSAGGWNKLIYRRMHYLCIQKKKNKDYSARVIKQKDEKADNDGEGRDQGTKVQNAASEAKARTNSPPKPQQGRKSKKQVCLFLFFFEDGRVFFSDKLLDANNSSHKSSKNESSSFSFLLFCARARREQVAIFRNPVEERLDPDFQRNYCRGQSIRNYPAMPSTSPPLPPYPPQAHTHQYQYQYQIPTYDSEFPALGPAPSHMSPYPRGNYGTYHSQAQHQHQRQQQKYNPSQVYWPSRVYRSSSFLL